MKAVIDDKIPFIFGKIERIIPETTYISGEKITRQALLDADILIVRTRTRCDYNLLHDTPVRLVITATIGYDHIDTQWCESVGIEWHNCPGCNANSVATYIRNVLNVLLPTSDCQSHTLGIIGVGHVGSIVRKNAVEAGYNVLCYDPYLSLNRLEDIKETADIITFHVPLTRDGEYPSFHIADETFFRSLKCSPIIINSSRGGVVDESALLSALNNGLVGGAVIDTWEGEPKISPLLLEKALITTPHIAGYSANGKWNATNMVLSMVADFVDVDADVDIEAPLFTDYPKLTTETLLSDSTLLKAHPEQFESMRSNYPKRQE